MRRKVYVSIGNSDDKLTQREWADFVFHVDNDLSLDGNEFFGAWYSSPDSPWQNACWLVEMEEEHMEAAKDRLRRIGQEFRQDFIAWAEAPVTIFLNSEGDK